MKNVLVNILSKSIALVWSIILFAIILVPCIILLRAVIFIINIIKNSI